MILLSRTSFRQGRSSGKGGLGSALGGTGGLLLPFGAGDGSREMSYAGGGEGWRRGALASASASAALESAIENLKFGCALRVAVRRYCGALS